MANLVKIETLKKGDLFMLKNTAVKETNVFMFNGYCRFNKKYEGTRMSDIGSYTYKKKGTLIHIDFEF